MKTLLTPKTIETFLWTNYITYYYFNKQSIYTTIYKK